MAGNAPYVDRGLIVGIDPGTTAGIAILDLGGNFLLTESRRNFSRAEMNKFIAGLGRPVIIATDSFPAPRMIEKISASFFSKLFMPRQNLSKREKNRIVKAFLQDTKLIHPWKNSHEKDALASALFAWKHARAIIAKVDRRLSQYNPGDPKLSEYVKANVIVNRESVSNSVKKFVLENNIIPKQNNKQ